MIFWKHLSTFKIVNNFLFPIFSIFLLIKNLSYFSSIYPF